jgi:hypothetical protein
MVAVMLVVVSSGVVRAGPCELPEFKTDNFGSPADNPYLPQSVIGSTFVYEAEDEDGLIVNYIEFTGVPIGIMGVTCTVVYDVEYLILEDGTPIKLEETWDWHAWDNYGNFWYFGEDTIEYEYNDEWEVEACNDDGSWEAGVDDALPGIILPADPRQGDCYQQEYYEDEAEDAGKVLKVNETCEVPFDNESEESEECMVMKEWTPLEPGNVEHKIYYPGVGLVHIKELKEKTVEVDLVSFYEGEAPSDLHIPICPPEPPE